MKNDENVQLVNEENTVGSGGNSQPPKKHKLNARQTTLRLAFTAMFTALVMVATFFIKVPTLTSDGYANLGDAVVFMCALTMGPFSALIAGGVGSCLADIIAGYGMWAPWTLIIKGLEGLIAGLLCRLIAKRVVKKPIALTFQILSLIISALWMVLGYFLARWLVISAGNPDAWAAAVAEVPFNLAQGGISVAIACVLVFVKGITPKERFF